MTTLRLLTVLLLTLGIAVAGFRVANAEDDNDLTFAATVELDIRIHVVVAEDGKGSGEALLQVGIGRSTDHSHFVAFAA